MGLIEKHTPKSALKDFTHDPKLLVAASGYSRGTLTRPLLLYGSHGTGKTAFAKALAMSMAPDMYAGDIEFIDVSSDTSIDAVRRISNMIGLIQRNSRNLKVFILDEVDGFSRQAMGAQGSTHQIPKHGHWGVLYPNDESHWSVDSACARPLQRGAHDTNDCR